MTLKECTSLQNGKYRIKDVIGQGGFGITYRAEALEIVQKALGEMRISITVAIKEFFLKDSCYRIQKSQKVSVYPDKEKLFVNFKKKLLEKESLLVSQFRHPHIVTVLDAFEENNTAYLVMEYIDGIDLDRLIEKKQHLSIEQSMHYARQIASALSAAHQKGVIHLDVKPANILITPENHIKLIDFGVAKQYATASLESQIKTTTITGFSRYFAPPEQCVSQTREALSPAADVYAFGGTLYQCLTSVLPYEVVARIQDEMPMAHIVNPNVPEQMGRVIAQAMALKQKERFQTVEAFLEALEEAALAPLPKQTHPPPSSSPSQHDYNGKNEETKLFPKNPIIPNTPKPSTYFRRPLLVTIFLCVLVAGVILFFLRPRGGNPSTSSRATNTKDSSLTTNTVINDHINDTVTKMTNETQQPSATSPIQQKPKSEINPKINEDADREERLKKYEDYEKKLGLHFKVVQRKSDNKWGIIDNDGFEKIKFEYKQASVILKDGCYGLFNEQNLWDVFDPMLTKIASGINDLDEYR